MFINVFLLCLLKPGPREPRPGEGKEELLGVCDILSRGAGVCLVLVDRADGDLLTVGQRRIVAVYALAELSAVEVAVGRVGHLDVDACGLVQEPGLEQDDFARMDLPAVFRGDLEGDDIIFRAYEFFERIVHVKNAGVVCRVLFGEEVAFGIQAVAGHEVEGDDGCCCEQREEAEVLHGGFVLEVLCI